MSDEVKRRVLMNYDFSNRDDDRICEAENCLRGILSPSIFCRAHWQLIREDLQKSIVEAVLDRNKDRLDFLVEEAVDAIERYEKHVAAREGKR